MLAYGSGMFGVGRAMSKYVHEAQPFSLSLCPRVSQICFGICEEELPGYTYFGTQYSFEVYPVTP